MIKNNYQRVLDLHQIHLINKVRVVRHAINKVGWAKSGSGRVRVVRVRQGYVRVGSGRVINSGYVRVG
ncbi:hypothetical protein CISIN_1g037662mg [Citrus sinensis]|uniref:Uncharacterized protein n=1 Tax=Citrus sinensis TaxID=2711 RepID=A0A067DB00_CITSI|nr:hypothetical protein CISIN_1g037662mg [Citrus sinensis]